MNTPPQLFGSFTGFRIPGFRAVLIVVILLGIVFRLGNLAAKPYWEDEIYTAMRVSGYGLQTVAEEIRGQSISTEALSHYYQVSSERSWKETSLALARRPEHAPLYFLLTRAWAQRFGSSEIAIRTLPALFSLIALPLFYRLSLRLFNSPYSASVTTALACLSPILIRQAQEARPYSLWVCGILASSIMLLQALENDRRRSWFIYSITVAFTGLTHLLSVFVLLAHVLYVFILSRFILSRELPARLPERLSEKSPEKSPEKLPKNKRASAKTKHFFIALSIGILPLLPWLGLVAYRRSAVKEVTDWLQQDASFGTLIVEWLENASHLLFAWLPAGGGRWLVFVPLVGLIVWATFRLMQASKLPQWLLPVLLCGVPIVALVTPDLLLGGMRSLISRYFLPTYIGTLLILGFSLSGPHTKTPTVSSRAFWIWPISLYAVLTIASSSAWFNYNAASWWGNPDVNVQMAQTVMQSSTPVEVYSDQRLGSFITFANLLRPTDYINWLDSKVPYPDNLFESSRTTFLLAPSNELLDRAKKMAATQPFILKPIKQDLSGNDLGQTLFQIQR